MCVVLQKKRLYPVYSHWL